MPRVPMNNALRSPGRRLSVCALALAALVVSSVQADAQPQCPSLVLNGSSSYATAAHTVYPNASDLVSFTVEAWIYPTSTSTPVMIMADDAYDLLLVTSSSSLALRMVFYSEAGSTTFTRVEISENQWNHVAVTYDAGSAEVRLFINGIRSGAQTVPASSFRVSANNLTIGATGSGSSLFHGYIDDVRISNSVRYSLNFPPPSSITADDNTRALYTFSEASAATSFADSSGNGHTLTAVNGAQAGNSPTANCAPVISPQPASQTIVPGDAALMAVRTLGPVPSTYQWYAGSSGDMSNPISGATSATYLTPALGSTTPYWVNVSNVNGSTASNTATLTVLAPGAAFSVDSTADAVDMTPGDGICAAAGGACTLRAAIQESNALSGTSHVITVPAGTFTMTIPGRGETAGATGDFNIHGYVRITGAGAAATILDGAGVDRLFEASSGGLSLADLTIQNGNPGNGFGGGILITGPNLILTRAIVTSNTTGFNGGGLAIRLGTLIVTQSTIALNTAGSFSGGLYLSSVTAAVVRTAITGNTATHVGGGVGVSSLADPSYAGAPSTVSIGNTTISGNSSSSGGALYLPCCNTVELSNDTIAANSSGSNAAVEIYSAQVQVRNTIISGNTGGSAPNCLVYVAGTLTSLGNNLEFPGTSCGFSLPSDRRADPMLGALASNGGPTQTHAIAVGSPAVGAGADAACSATPVSGVDQRGVTRPKGAHCDIGAYESAIQFTDDPIVAGSMLIRAVHLSELRVAIDALRGRRSLSAMTWTDPAITAGVTSIRAIHLAELRSALDAVYVADGLSPPSWTPALVAGVTPVTAAQIEQVRQAVRAVE
jgi:CSLREA domain-containing protein